MYRGEKSVFPGFNVTLIDITTSTKETQTGMPNKGATLRLKDLRADP
jgi:hypothetical protein